MIVTVLMSVYDTPPSFLEQAVQSIREQSYRDFEFLILDDGSNSQATKDALRNSAKKDSRIRLLFETHRGLTKTLNRGLSEARGVFVARQDADDWSAPHRLERQVTYLTQFSGASVCGANAWTHQHDGARLWATRLPQTSEQIAAAFWKGNPFVHGSTMFRTDAARRAGGYREEFVCSQDYDFFWRLAEVGRGANLREPLYHYRYSGGAISARRATEQATVHRATQLLALSRSRRQTENVEAALKQAIREMQGTASSYRCGLKNADHILLAGHYGAALRGYAELVRSRPAAFLGWAKLARWAIFAACPPAREACFSW